MIRKVHFSDLNELLEIEAEAFPKSQYDLQELWSLHLRYPKTFLVAIGDQIDGYIVSSPDGHIISMAVRAACRRCGIGTRLVQEIATRCAGSSLQLEVRVGNVGAQKFYQKLGFRTLGKRHKYYHNGEDALLMELSDIGSGTAENR